MMDEDDEDEEHSSLTQNSDSSGRFSDSDICVLDCIFNKQVKAYFIIDLLQWQETSYREYPLAVRLHCLQQKMAEIAPKLAQFPRAEFKIVPYRDCTLENFNACYYGPILQPFLSRSASGCSVPDLAAIQRDLQESSSILSVQLSRAVAVSEHFLYSNRNNNSPPIDLTQLDQIVRLLAKINADENLQQLWVSDGLIFANSQQDYNEGVNPLTLQWKDSLCSFFPLVQQRD